MESQKKREGEIRNFILFYFILFYFILFYFILFYFILFYFILFYFIFLVYFWSPAAQRGLWPSHSYVF